MDDAVTFNLPDAPLPGFGIPDPTMITPIEDSMVCGYPQSYDVSFELDTDPRWIKWEQPFTSLRHWPHFEDIRSMAIETPDGNIDYDQLVADDWLCRKKTPVTACVWWGSYIGYGYEACKCSPLSAGVVPQKPDYFMLSIWDDIPAGVDPGIPFSHPNEPIWKYRASEYDQVLVGFDKHPHGDPNEPVFRYSVKLPKERWFKQKDVNDVYWFSVVAVYKDNPRYPWGWTNHPHFFNDDAVIGHLDPPDYWTWKELVDQTGKTADMSFMLFTWPWPPCWDHTQCWGDSNADHVVNITDFFALKDSWTKCYPDPDYNPCADFNRSGCVNISDFFILKDHWTLTVDPNCSLGGVWPP
jgi:hypothetical protein